MRSVLVGALVTLIVALWAVAVLAVVAGWIPQWTLFLLVPFAIAVAVRLQRFLDAHARADDPLAPWREFRVVRRLELEADGRQNPCLTLELVRDLDEPEPAVRLRFEKVRRLQAQQIGDHALMFDGLYCRALRVRRPGGARFRVEDRHGEALGFDCDSFAQVAEAPIEDSA
ncbi:MAG: hypothetical protein KDE27_25840 [Planctomycetes bacterium]|nr:hypothetical protein [Planctomycetota bacterium]